MRILKKEFTSKCDASDIERIDTPVKYLEEKLSKYDAVLEPRLASLENQLQVNMASCTTEQVNPVSDEDLIELVV